jgi:hypothetical protein
MANLRGLIDRPRLALLIGIAAGVLALSLMIRFYGWENTFALWDIPDLHLPFLDVRLITGGAESYAQGYDPALYNPGDPRGRIFNYPKIWYLVLASGIDQRWSVPLAIAMIALFLGSVYAFPGRLTGFSVFFILFALISSAAMLAFERANVDFIIFSLMTLSLILLDRSAISAFGVMALAILLKIIPVLGLGAFAGRDRIASLRPILGSILLTVLYFLFTLKDMLFIFHSTEKGFGAAYGVAVLPDLLHDMVQVHAIHEAPLLFYKVVTRLDQLFFRIPPLPYVVAILILVAGVYLGWRHRDRSGAPDSRNLRAFWMGAGMYIGTFFIGNNWDYRLIFLVLTLPQLGDWAIHMNRTTKAVSIFGLAMLFLSMWYSVTDAALAALSFGAFLSGLFTTVANWALFGALIYLFVLSLPGWVYQDPRALFSGLLPGRRPSATPAAPWEKSLP